MALINKKHVTERETASYKLDRATIELVKSYSEFIGSPQEHVVNEALRYLFRKDKDFGDWLKSHNKPLQSSPADAQAASIKPRNRTTPATPSGSKLVGGTES